VKNEFRKVFGCRGYYRSRGDGIFNHLGANSGAEIKGNTLENKVLPFLEFDKYIYIC